MIEPIEADVVQPVDEIRCPKCGVLMEYRAIPLFGDFDLGIRAEFYRCPNCFTTKEIV